MKAQVSLGIAFTTLVLLACVCTSTSTGSDVVAFTPEASEQETSQYQATATEEPEATNNPTSTDVLEPTPNENPSETPEPSPTIETLLDVFSILGKPVDDVEAIIGQTEWTTPKENNDHFVGGEYRDYRIGDYGVFVTYDNEGIARIFQVETGLSDEDYSLEDWGLVLSRFGIFPSTPPEREFPAAVYWDNYDGYYIAILASNVSGKPVWSVQVSEAPFIP